MKAIGLTAVLILALFILIKGVTQPYHNWDMIGYTASLYHLDGHRGKELSDQVFTDIHSEVSEEVFEALTTGNSYSQTVYLESKSLEQQVPFYQIRPLYLALVKLFSYASGSYSKATYYVSALFAASIVIVLYQLLVTLGLNPLWVFPIVHIAKLDKLARLSTPDALGAFVLLFCSYLLIRNREKTSTSSIAAAFFFIAVLPFFRTDYVIFSVILSLALSLFYRKSLLLIAGAVAVFIYFSINALVGNYGYFTIFNFTLIELSPYPQSMYLHSDIATYLDVYVKGVKKLISQKTPYLAIFLIVCLYFKHSDIYRDIIKLKNFKKASVTELEILCLTFVGFYMAHFMLFPAAFSRSYTAVLIILSVYAAMQIEVKVKSYQKISRGGS